MEAATAPTHRRPIGSAALWPPLTTARVSRKTVRRSSHCDPQIVRGVLTAWLHGEHADMAGARAAIESLLRDEFDDTARTTLNEIRLDDE